jgi:hypothetical protein
LIAVVTSRGRMFWRSSIIDGYEDDVTRVIMELHKRTVLVRAMTGDMTFAPCHQKVSDHADAICQCY